MKRYIKSSKTLEDYENMGVFDRNQMDQIREGFKNGVDVSVYADPKKYDWSQMIEIRRGLESGIDVSEYADPKYGWSQMREIRRGLESGIDVFQYADPEYDDHQMEQIRKGLESGVDVSLYTDPKYSWSQMQQIRWELQGLLKPQKKSTPIWKSLFDKLESEAESGIDSLYEQTEAGRYLNSLCKQVEERLDIYVEPSVQAGVGSVWIWDNSTDEALVEDYDYNDFNNDIFYLAANASNEAEFKSSYESYLTNLCRL